jgi:hypothetical protein
MVTEPTEGEIELPDLRAAMRHVLPPGISASLRLGSGRTIYVTVANLSRTGVCVFRRGLFEVKANEEVVLDVSDFEKQSSLVLPSLVQWVDVRGYGSLVGLLFKDGPLLPGTMLDQYLDQFLMGRGGFDEV